MNIDIKRLEEIKEELSSMSEDDVLFIDENGKNKYAILPIKKYDRADELLSLLSDTSFSPKVKIIGMNEDISFEEYEKIKATIMEVVDKTFKPKAEKLN